MSLKVSFRPLQSWVKNQNPVSVCVVGGVPVRPHIAIGGVTGLHRNVMILFCDVIYTYLWRDKRRPGERE